MNYVVAVLPDRTQVEAAHSALTKEGLLDNQIDILGSGYKNAEEYRLLDHNKYTKKGAKRLFSWLVPFGFVAGYTFNFLTDIEILPTASNVVNHILGGLLGAMSGALGAYFVAGGVDLTEGSKHTLPYRNRLDEGKYLIVVKGTEELTHQATDVLRQFEPENIQGYTEPTGA